MTLNKYAIAWTNEDLQSATDDEEAWYFKNVEYLYARDWVKGNLIHGIIALVFTTLMFMGNAINGEAAAFAKWFSILFVAEMAYLVFGVNRFFLSNRNVAIPGYIFTLAFGVIAVSTSQNEISKIIFGVLGILLNLFLTIAVPAYLIKRFKDYRRDRKKYDELFSMSSADRLKIWFEDLNRKYGGGNYSPDDSDYANGDSHDGSESDSSGGDSGSSSGETYHAETDKLMQQAMDLFNGYLSTPDMLKKRYRELTKTYHPDVEGGNEELFKRINAAYQILQNEIF